MTRTRRKAHKSAGGHGFREDAWPPYAPSVRDMMRVRRLAEDAKTPSAYLGLSDRAPLIRLLDSIGATDANIDQVHDCIRK
jgi:hypothetical protein